MGRHELVGRGLVLIVAPRPRKRQFLVGRKDRVRVNRPQIQSHTYGVSGPRRGVRDGSPSMHTESNDNLCVSRRGGPSPHSIGHDHTKESVSGRLLTSYIKNAGYCQFKLRIVGIAHDPRMSGDAAAPFAANAMGVS